MNLASLDGSDDDYFLTLKNYLNPFLANHVDPEESYSNVAMRFKNEYKSITNQIQLIEETVEKFEKDLVILSNAGENIASSEMKQQLKQVCEDYIASNQLDQIKQNVEELYKKQKSYLKAMSPLLHEFDHFTCPICFEREVYVYNQPCGHTLCIECSRQSKKCPMCRALTNYKPLIYSV